MEKTTIKVSGMHCQNCAANLTKSLGKEKGVKTANVNFATEKAAIEFNPKQTSEEQLLKAIKVKGYSGHVVKDHQTHHEIKVEEQESQKELKKLRFKVILSAIFAVPVFILGMFFMKTPLIPYQEYVMWVLATPVQFYVGKQFYQGTWSALKNYTSNMDTLIAMGTSAAYFYSVYVVLFSATGHQYFEASAVLITLVIFGKYLEAIAKGKTSEAISKLMKLGAKTATVIRGRKELKISIDEVVVGDIVVVTQV